VLVDDRTCLERIGQGGKPAQTALTVLYERYARVFYGYLRHHRFRFSHAESEDILQDTFVRLARLRGRAFAVPDLPRPWLYKILVHCAIDHHRQRPAENRAAQSGGQRDDDLSATPWEERTPGPLLPEATWAGVHAALLAFQTDYPEPGAALELTILEGWGIRELAQFLDKPEGATREYLSYWRKRLRDYLQRFCPDCFATDGDGD
jgi:DNA-directed RNA polymerase specialized sigma24 family protein